MSATFHIHCSSNVMMKNFDKYWDHQRYIENLAAAMQENAKGFKQTSWALIDDIRGWPIRIPEQIDLSNAVLKNMVLLGMTHCAVCVDDLAVSKWMMKKIVPKKVLLKFFSNIDDCKKWLREQGFDTDFAQPFLRHETLKV